VGGVSTGATRVRPWFLRLLDSTPWSIPEAAGLLAAVLLAYNAALWRFVPGAIPPGVPHELLLIFPIGIFYVLVVASICQRVALRDLASLRPHLACSDGEYAELERALTHPPRALVVSGSLAGLVIMVLLRVFGVPGRLDVLPSPWLLPIGLQALLFWAVAVPTLLVIASHAAAFGRIGRASLCVDLFDRRPVQPFVRVGLRVALVLLGLVGLRAAFYAYSAPTALVLANLGPMVVVVALATASLALPLRGVRARILAAKAAELERVQREIDRRRGEDPAPLDADEGVPRAFLNLLEYREKVEAVSEWPFDAPALVRFAAYLLIPVAGWIGGALMEQLIDALMG
jgi:hypothetical protein